MGEIFNSGYGAQSLYRAYLKADSRVSIQSNAYIHFQMYLGGKPISLHEVLLQQPSNILPEEAPSLLAHGDVVQFTRTNKEIRVISCTGSGDASICHSSFRL